MNNIEQKIEEVRKKIGEKNLALISFAIVCVIITGLMMLLKEFKIQKQEVQSGYNRALYDFVSNINNVKNEMLKLKISTNDTYTLTTISSIFAKSNSAKANLDILPFSQDSSDNTSKFLNQLSDFSYNLMRNILNGDKVENYMKNINSLYKKVEELSKITEEIYADLNSGKIKWDELERVGNEKMKAANANEEVSSVNSIGKTFTEYEGIIYDGAFSNHILTLKPAYLTDVELSSNDVKDIIRNKINIDNIEFKEEINGRIPLYVYEANVRDNDVSKTIYATKNDGKIYQMISDRVVNEERINIEEAREFAKSFIQKLGIENIEPTYYLKQDNMVTISYAAIEEDVIIYSDLIKVKVALDDGEIMTFEANGYIYNHKDREINPSRTIEEARETLNSGINTTNERLAIIPTDSKDEVLTYEFKGTVEDQEFLVYVNANTLVTEKIYILLETPGGTLAM